MIRPVSIKASDAEPRRKPSNYPEPFRSMFPGRTKRPLGDIFGLRNFGVNLTQLAPGTASALRHAHTRQDEFILIVSGHPLLHTDRGMHRLGPGDCAGFPAGAGDAHRLLNDTNEEVTYIEVGDRTPDDEVSYPDDDIKAILTPAGWEFVHKDGSPYDSAA